jgi:uncharacterized membrane protein
MRWLLWLVVGVLVGGIVHLATILLLPTVATHNAYARLATITPVNVVTPLPQITPDAAVLPFMDPAFAVSVCRYDLKAGPLKLSAPVSDSYTSASFYTPQGVVYYAINDRSAGRRAIELDLMTADQKAELPENEEITAADRLIVESPTNTGLIVLRALAPEPGQLQLVRSVLDRARCERAPQ